MKIKAQRKAVYKIKKPSKILNMSELPPNRNPEDPNETEGENLALEQVRAKLFPNEFHLPDLQPYQKLYISCINGTSFSIIRTDDQFMMDASHGEDKAIKIMGKTDIKFKLGNKMNELFVQEIRIGINPENLSDQETIEVKMVQTADVQIGMSIGVYTEDHNEYLIQRRERQFVYIWNVTDKNIHPILIGIIPEDEIIANGLKLSCRTTDNRQSVIETSPVTEISIYLTPDDND